MTRELADDPRRASRSPSQPAWYHDASLHAAFASVSAWSLRVSASLALLASGCATPQPQTPIGMSNAAPEPQQVSIAPAQRAPRTWPDFVAARAWPEGAPPAVSLGHRRDGALVHVLVEPNALPAYRALAVDSPLPEGARVVAWHTTLEGTLLGGYVLEKRGGSWAALQLDASGRVVPGDRSACVRCHDMAPTDHLFGARSAPPAAGDLGRESDEPSAR